MTAPDAKVSEMALYEVLTVMNAWRTGVNAQLRHVGVYVDDDADVATENAATIAKIESILSALRATAEPKPADEFEADVRDVVAALVDGTGSDAHFLLSDPSNRLLDAREYGAMPAGDLAVEIAYLLRESGGSDVGVHGAAGLCILALVGRRMAAREAAKGGR